MSITARTLLQVSLQAKATNVRWQGAVFDTVWEARQKTECNDSMVFVPAPAAADSILEAVDAEWNWLFASAKEFR